MRRAAYLAGRDPGLFLDLGDRALLGVEELVVDLLPAAEVLDRLEVLGVRELRLVLGEDGLVDRAVAPVGEALLALLAEDVVDERPCRGRDALVVVGKRDVDAQRVVGDDVLDVLALLLRGRRLVLVGEEDVALAAGERLQRLAAGLGLDADVLLDQLVDVVEAAVREGAQEVPLRRARGERVRGHDLDARLEQVVPGADVLGVALADDEGDDRRGDEAVRGRVLPALVDQARVDEPRHVGLDRERDVVGGQAGLDGAALVAGCAVGRLELDAPALGLLWKPGMISS
jgi:hypothetical protein